MVYKDYLIAYVLKAKAKRRQAQTGDALSEINENHAAFRDRPGFCSDKHAFSTLRSRHKAAGHRHDSAAQFRASDDVTDRSLQQTPYDVLEQLETSKDVAPPASLQHNWAPTNQMPQQSKQSHLQQREADLAAASKHVRGSQHDSCNLALGSLLFGAFLFICGSAPWLLPELFLLFALICLPWRVRQFYQNRQGFFLLDFCYWVDLATVGYVLFGTSNPRMDMMIHALADGPLASALLVWQCGWVFGSASHAVSVLVHLLPGLAMFALKYAPLPSLALENPTFRMLSSVSIVRHRQQQQQQQPQENALVWLILAPLGFYAVWQITYWFIVQVCCERIIKQHKYDTSYSCLAKRAAKTNSIWNRFIRRGCKARRICLFGATQLVFTLLSLSLFVPVYNSFWLGYLWQVIKLAVTVYYGSIYQVEKVPQHLVMRAVQSNKVHLGLVNQGKIAALKAARTARAS